MYKSSQRFFPTPANYVACAFLSIQCQFKCHFLREAFSDHHSSISTYILFKILFLFYFWPDPAWLARSQFPDQGLNPGPQEWKHKILTTGPPGNPLNLFFYSLITFFKKSLCSSTCFLSVICHSTRLCSPLLRAGTVGLVNSGVPSSCNSASLLVGAQ